MEFIEEDGGCCIARCGDAALKLGRIMLQYRPIAPRPASVASSAIVPDNIGRGKRGSRARDGKRGRKARRVKEVPAIVEAVTLPLMPETPDRKEMAPSMPSPTTSTGMVVSPRLVRAAGAWVTVDRVTDTWSSEAGNEGAWRVMEGCPVFVSEGERVVWTNDEFRRMVVGEGEEEEEVRVALVTRGLVPEETSWRGFTCRVTVRYMRRNRGRMMLAAPCDVWRMEGGGLAWRVDVNAALSLSLV